MGPNASPAGATPTPARSSTACSGSGFEDSDEIERVVSIETDCVVERQRIGCRFEVRNPEGRFVGEQQACYKEQDGQIT